MNNQLNFDAEILTSEIMKNMNIPISMKKKSIKAMSNMSASRLVSNVKVEDLIIDLSYQRKPNEQKVAKIIRDFDPNSIGVLICSMRENGDVAVIDGGHRIAALNAMNMGNTDVRCLVFFELTLAQEAEMFATLNDNRTKPKTMDIFKSKVVAGDADASAVQSILNKMGLSISNGPANNSVRAIGTVNAIYRNHGKKVLENTLFVLSTAFDKHSSSFSDSALIAVSKMFATYKDRIDINRFCSILASFGNANLWINKGGAVAKTMGYRDTNVGMIVCFMNEYNKRLKSNRLDIREII